MGSRDVKKLSLVFYWLFAFLYWEVLVHAGMYDQFQASFRYALGLSGALALIVSLLVGMLPQKLLFPVNLLLTLGGTFLYGSQMVYCFIFGTPYSVSQMGLGAGAVSQFYREMLSTMAQNWPWIAALLLPLAVLPLLSCLHWVQRPTWVSRLAAVLLAAVLGITVWTDICRGGTHMFSDHYFFTSRKSTTAQTMERFGVPITFVLELTRPEDSGSSMGNAVVLPPVDSPDGTVPEETTAPIVYNVLPLDFESLNAGTDNEKIIALNNYFSQLPGTNQNEYTGMLQDYNLIFICAESFSPAAVDPVYTPTLYKLTHEGFLFRNYYTTFPNTTTDGEYTLTQGLYPDSTKDKYSSSMMASANNYLPFALGNFFESEFGVKSWGYHNNVGNYYRRDLSHPNMGYEMKFNRDGMTFSGYWPTSDLEMMEQSVDDYINEPQFHAYYMTFSGHYQYNPKENGVVHKHYLTMENGPWKQMTQKGYVACHIELDKALEYLLNRLEEAGIADKTAIVMATDHTPYGLAKDLYFEMIGQEEDFFSWYKSDLIFWIGGLEEPVVVEEYCSTADVLPTILNLWGFPYDSRMYPGTDVFSDGLHAAVLIDHSFLTDKVWFNSNTGEIRYQVPQEEVPEGYVESMNQLIASRFEFSAEILRNNYYQYVFGTE
ncbi:MAG: LTA synthase family protein [Oscillospiraceae bacterium]|nr:LTA synthase family protein [Oscillospiraceae bacterium]